LPAEGPCQFPDLIQRLLAADEIVAAFRSDAEWFDIGTVPEHQRAVEAFEQDPEVFAT
jgi:NDP-sugar pyrophosphorylase family protein